MKGKSGVMEALPPWDADRLDEWAASPIPSHGERVTAQFLLAVWNPDHPWICGKFELMDAIRVWDDAHRTAFLNWASDLWWP
jgi:hypothetical protein